MGRIRNKPKNKKLRRKRCIHCVSSFDTAVIKQVLCKQCIIKKHEITSYLQSKGIIDTMISKALVALKLKPGYHQDRQINSKRSLDIIQKEENMKNSIPEHFS